MTVWAMSAAAGLPRLRSFTAIARNLETVASSPPENPSVSILAAPTNEFAVAESSRRMAPLGEKITREGAGAALFEPLVSRARKMSKRAASQLQGPSVIASMPVVGQALRKASTALRAVEIQSGPNLPCPDFDKSRKRRSGAPGSARSSAPKRSAAISKRKKRASPGRSAHPFRVSLPRSVLDLVRQRSSLFSVHPSLGLPCGTNPDYALRVGGSGLNI